MIIPKIFTVTGQYHSYTLRQVQALTSDQPAVPEQLFTALQQCHSEEQLLDFYFTTDMPVNEAFILLFEQRLREVEANAFLSLNNLNH